nr:MAG TPA: shock protein B [Crassvirales sp.]
MSTAVQMTVIICVTLVALIWIAAKYDSDRNNSKKK